MATVKTSRSSDAGEIQVSGIDVGVSPFAIVGTSPLIFNRMAEKAKRELLLPKGRKTAADKAQSIKHDPVEEFRASVYRRLGDEGATRLIFPAPAFKGAMSTAALETPGAKKAQIGRLVWVEGTHVDIYGIPELFMSVVRSADMNRTPDIRTRAILREWACVVTINYALPTITPTVIGTLLSAAGKIIGVGDFRQEKSKGNYGQFELTEEDDARFVRIVETMRRDAQDQALQDATPYDADSEELLAWWNTEILARGRTRKEDAKEKETVNG